MRPSGTCKIAQPLCCAETCRQRPRKERRFGASHTSLPLATKQKGREPGEANAPEQGLGLNKRPLDFTPSVRIDHLGIMSLRQSTNGKRPG